MKFILKKILAAAGYQVSQVEFRDRREKTLSDQAKFIEFLSSGAFGSGGRSQLGQDIFALAANKFKRGGYFVEFGATNGIDLSNTYALEKEYGWKGILSEPATVWHEDLKKNRSCHIDFRCVWRESGSRLSFDVVEDPELSTLSSYSESDHHSETRKNRSTFEVLTVSLLDLLKEKQAPSCIDYLSVDTEGSEYEILQAFDFSQYSFNCLTVEHNNSPARADIHRLLRSKGYCRVFEGVSKWDDWYIPL